MKTDNQPPEPAPSDVKTLLDEPKESRLLDLAISLHRDVEGEYGCNGATCPGVQRLMDHLRPLVGVGKASWLPAAALPVSPQEPEPMQNVNLQTNDGMALTVILDLLAKDRPEGLNWPGVARLIRRQLAAAVPPPQTWYLCECGAEHSTPECPFAAIPPPPREEPAKEMLRKLSRDMGTMRIVLARKSVFGPDDQDQDRMLERWEAQITQIESVLAAAALPETPKEADHGEMQPVVDELRRRMKAGHGIEEEIEPDSAEWWRNVSQKLGVELHEARLAHECSEAVLSMAVSRLGGLVEGRPTHRINFLQRIDALVAAEAPALLVERGRDPQDSRRWRCPDCGLANQWENLECARCHLIQPPDRERWEFKPFVRSDRERLPAVERGRDEELKALAEKWLAVRAYGDDSWSQGYRAACRHCADALAALRSPSADKRAWIDKDPKVAELMAAAAHASGRLEKTDPQLSARLWDAIAVLTAPSADSPGKG